MPLVNKAEDAYMERRNIVSVSWGDHLTFGEGDGRLANPAALRRRMERWKDELNAATVHWRLTRSHIKGHYYAARGRQHPLRDQDRNLDWNFFQVVPQLAHSVGMKAYLYVSLFDEGWPLQPRRVREVSYHNAMHQQHISWQTAFSREHPEYTLVDRTNQQRQWGVLCLAYPEVRAHFRNRFKNLLRDTKFDGLFLCLRSQSRPADFADQFGFNEPVRHDYLSRYGRDICTEDFDLRAWRELIINQNSSQCPSMWHQLWPMHRGYGYLQNCLDGYNMSPLMDHLSSDYGPVLENRPVNLYVARQWDERSETQEKKLLSHPAVKGLGFSSFRYDNPGPVSRNIWSV
jgi:hypothetical protein